MATRFYCPSTTAAAVSPTFGTYSRTGTAIRRRAVTVKLSEGFTTLTENADAADSAPYDILYAQYVTDELSAATLAGAGTFKGVFRIASSNASSWSGGTNEGIGIRLAKCASDGSSVVEIIAKIISSTLLATGSALTNNQVRDGATTPVSIGSDVTLNANDRLIVELFLRERSTNASRTGLIELGDNSGSDLAEDDASTSQFSPWFEFSQDLVFAGAGGSAVPAKMHSYRRRRAA